LACETPLKESHSAAQEQISLLTLTSKNAPNIFGTMSNGIAPFLGLQEDITDDGSVQTTAYKPC